MDKDKRDLVDQLCVRAGMAMEDGSAIAVTTVDLEDLELRRRLVEIEGALERASVCIKAAKALSE